MPAIASSNWRRGCPRRIAPRRSTATTSRTSTLAPYAKLDFLANYKFNDSLALFGRVENVTDARYEEVYDFGTAGRSYYAGITYSW